jgi:hypothetical protein
MSAVDVGLLLAVGAFGWGLSLATYHLIAVRRGWPMGAWQSQRPERARRVGVACIVAALLFAVARGWGGYALSALVIPLFGLAWAVFWTGFLRVGAQSALLLAPVAACLLLVLWLG